MLNNLGDSERYLGNYGAAMGLLQSGLKVFRDIGQRMGESYMLCNLAWVAQARGDLTESLAWAEQAVALARQVKDRDLEAEHPLHPGPRAGRARPRRGVRAAYREALAIFREIGRPSMQPEPLAGLARVALAGGDTEEAMACMPPRSSTTSTAAATSTAPRTRCGSTSPATRCWPPPARRVPPTSCAGPTSC